MKEAPRGEGGMPRAAREGGTPIQDPEENRTPQRDPLYGTQKPEGTQLGAPRIEVLGSQVDSLIEALCKLFLSARLVDQTKTREAAQATSTWLNRYGIDVQYGKGRHIGWLKFQWVTPDRLSLEMLFDTRRAANPLLGRDYIDNMMSNLLEEIDRMRAERGETILVADS